MTDKIIKIDAGKSLGPFKPLNGVNGGPWVRGGTYDLTDNFREFSPPIVRLHDTRYNDEDTVDIHCIFPDMTADEDDPSCYRFEQTDEHLRTLVDLGIEIIYRLGESIEHGVKKYHIHPPEDPKKWGRVAANIVRHYNQGWANGFEWNIKRWEIWNEFDGRGSWTGTTEQYCELYRHAVTAIKAVAPDVMVGGPALATAMDSSDARAFLAFCRDNKLPLDFISWHGYTSHPKTLIEKIELGLRIVEEYGYSDTETQFNEWNFPPGGATGRSDTRASRSNAERVAGSLGAAYAGSVLAFMQDTGLDVACYYVAMGGIFRIGMFDRYMVPTKQFYVFKAFKEISDCITRVETSGADLDTGLGIVAGVSREQRTAAVLLSNFEDSESRYRVDLSGLPFDGEIRCREFVVDEDNELEEVREQILNCTDFSLMIDLPAPSVKLLKFDRV